MSELSARLVLPFIQPAQAQKHVTHNEALERLDILVQLSVQSFNATTPPAVREQGQIWALGPAPSGEWAGEGGKLAAWINSAWLFIPPAQGWVGTQGRTLRVWDGGQWAAPDLPELQNLDGLGVNTSYDATNRLAVASDATLLTHDGAGHQVKLNKHGVADTASLLFQTGWSGRAEMGTAGNDNWSIKVSPDGAHWHDGLVIDGSSGAVSVENGLIVSGLLTGTAVTQSPTDDTLGRILTTDAGAVQAYRQGNILGAVSQSGGMPTGAVIQRGQNANGAFVRFADGTQICTNQAFQTSDEGSLTWTYPAAFLYPSSPGRPAVTGAISTTSTQTAVLGIGGITGSSGVATSVTVWARQISNDTFVARGASLIAIGRWY
jgi:hypothetical protein